MSSTVNFATASAISGAHTQATDGSYTTSPSCQLRLSAFDVRPTGGRRPPRFTTVCRSGAGPLGRREIYQESRRGETPNRTTAASRRSTPSRRRRSAGRSTRFTASTFRCSHAESRSSSRSWASSEFRTGLYRCRSSSRKPEEWATTNSGPRGRPSVYKGIDLGRPKWESWAPAFRRDDGFIALGRIGSSIVAVSRRTAHVESRPVEWPSPGLNSAWR